LWAFVGLLWGFGALVIATSIGVPIGDNLKAASTNYPRYLYTFLYEMTNTAIAEESIFRGFLWGTLRKTGWAERKILLIQAILFAIIHLNSYDVHSIAYYFAKFIFALFAGWLAWKSRSLVPSIISHSFHNTISFFLKSV
jgi:membrane protease YdiL (CAAX protease family)